MRLAPWETLSKARVGMPVGTIRIWAGISYIKHPDGNWVVVGGRHHGKKLGAFKEEPKAEHKEFADKHAEKKDDDKKEAPKKKDEPQLGFSFKKPEPKAAPKEEAPKEAKAPETAEDHAEKGPRKEATEQTKEQIAAAEAYAFRSKNAVINLGEDVAASARHKRNRFTGLADAEKDGSAEELINRDDLLELDPPDFSKITNTEALSTLAAHSALRRFTPKVPYPEETRDKADDDVVVLTFRLPNAYGQPIIRVPLHGKTVKERTDQFMSHNQGAEFVAQHTAGDIKREARKDYYDAYTRLKKKAESLSTSTDPRQVVSGMRDEVGLIIKELRNRDRNNLVANSLVNYHNNTLKTYGTPKATHVRGDLEEFAKLFYGKFTTDEEKKEALSSGKVKDIVLKILEGNTIAQAFGVSKEKGEREKKWNPADAYVSGKVERVGPKADVKVTDADFASPESFAKSEAAKFLMKDLQMRAVQPGNSLTVDEQKEHIEHFSNAMQDLMRVLELPLEMASFNGRLAVAFGARGKGNALAHYEPALRVINLTRAKGVGSLCHEWGHFFDNILSEVSGASKGGFFTEHYHHGEMTPTRAALRESVNALRREFNTFVGRMMKDPQARQMMGAGTAYWSSTVEVWARCFERHVQNKLASKGQKNTYLVAVKKNDNPLWPNDEEVAKMAPHFDAIFETFRKSDLMKKALALLSGKRWQKSFDPDNVRTDGESVSSSQKQQHYPGMVYDDIRCDVRKFLEEKSPLTAAALDKSQIGVRRLPDGSGYGGVFDAGAPYWYVMTGKGFEFRPAKDEENARKALSAMLDSEQRKSLILQRGASVKTFREISIDLGKSRRYEEEAFKELSRTLVVKAGWRGHRAYARRTKHGAVMIAPKLSVSYRETLRRLKEDHKDTKKQVAKAEGARGGKVVGHDASGKPIYEKKKIDFDAVVRQVTERKEHIKKLAASGKTMHKFPSKTGHVLVHPATRKPGTWQVTRFDHAGEPMGHSEAPTQEAAIHEAHMSGADIHKSRGHRAYTRHTKSGGLIVIGMKQGTMIRPAKDYEHGGALMPPEMWHGLQTHVGKIHVKRHKDGTYDVKHRVNKVDLPLATRAHESTARNAAERAYGQYLHSDAYHFPRQYQKVVQAAVKRGEAVSEEVKAHFPMLFLVKKSEGARGGHVIGHTKSGKPIYEHTKEHANAYRLHSKMGGRQGTENDYKQHVKNHVERHSGFSVEDHREAAELHGKRGKKTLGDKGKTSAGEAAQDIRGARFHWDMQDAHADAADQMEDDQDRARYKKKYGEEMDKALPVEKEEKVKQAKPTGKAASKKAGSGATGRTRYTYPDEKGKPGAAPKTRKMKTKGARPNGEGAKPNAGGPQEQVQNGGQPPAPEPQETPFVDPQKFATMLQMDVGTLKKIAAKFQTGTLGGRRGFIRFMTTQLKKLNDKHNFDDKYFALLYDSLVSPAPQQAPNPQAPPQGAA